MSFIPLSELQGERVNLALPEYVPTDQIAFNLARVDKLAALGGFASGVIITSFAGKTTEYQHGVVGFDTQGTAYAGASSVKRAESPEEEFEPERSLSNKILGLYHDRPPLTIRVNTAEVTQRIAQANGKLRDPGAWAARLNGAVAESLRRASWDHYVRRLRHGELAGFVLTHLLAGSPPGADMINGLIINNVARCAWAFLDGKRLSEVCWSLTPGIHPDRALLVSGLSRAIKVVKKI